MSKNIKEIGKELMGKSLNSFHRKTGLTQLEKNNEMQDGILNGILSQVDDAHIEKTEQSNVIHLDGSGDGVVVLDSIEGNTMVNLFGEFTFTNNFIKYGLNGVHIIVDKTNANTWATSYMKKLIKKPTTQYTYVVYVDDINGDAQLRIHKTHTSSVFDAVNLQKGLNVITFTTMTPDGDFYKDYIGFTPTTSIEGVFVKIKYIMLLEGDWTNKEIPPYFEGLQSSFEEKVNDEDKYEIEILSKNRNMIDLYDENILQQKHSDFKINSNSSCTLQSDVDGWRARYRIPVKKGRSYTLSANISDGVNYPIRINDKEETDNAKIWELNLGYLNGSGYKTKTFIATKDFVNILFYKGTSQPTCDITNIMLTPNDTNISFENMEQNKIKLLLNEPLRAVNNTKDRLCIKDNKLVVERNIYSQEISPNIGYIPFIKNNHLVFAITPRLTPKGVYGMCNMFATDNNGWQYIQSEESDNREFCQFYSNFNYIHIKKSRLSSSDAQGVNEWLLGNKVVLVYPLEEPYYEEVLNEYGEPILLEGYENGTLYIDSTIVPTTTVRYTPKMESFKTLKEVENNNIMLTNDVNDNIIPYMMEVDLMIIEKEMVLANQINIRKMEVLDMTSMQKRTQEMLERLIKGKTLTEQECKTRVTTYLNAGKITDEQAEELMLLIDEVYA